MLRFTYKTPLPCLRCQASSRSTPSPTLGGKAGHVFKPLAIQQTRQLKLTVPSVSTARSDGGNVTDLGYGSEVVYMPQFLTNQESWEYFHYLDNHIPWTRPTIYVSGKSFLQPRDVCYFANKGIKEFIYSGYKPEAHSWDDFPPLKEILEEVHKAFPGSHFNSVLINRYNNGNDYVGWHADDGKVYGPKPEIASISLGCAGEEANRAKNNNKCVEQYSFKMKHGSLLFMRGYTQRDWLHSVPKRANAVSARVNLTFRRVI